MAIEKQTDNFICEGCGSQKIFDPDTQGMKCTHCGRVDPVQTTLMEAPEYMYDPQNQAYTAPDWQMIGGHTIQCKGCGARTVIPSSSMTAECPFCGSLYVLDEDDINVGILPECMMPFKVSKDKALHLFMNWSRKRFWAPKAFKKMGHMTEKMHGVYIPFWTYDANLQTTFTGQGGEDYTVTRTRRVNGKTQTYTVTQTRWFPISGQQQLYFDDYQACGTRHVDVGMFQSLGAYSTKVLHKYKPEFLAGFTAQRYDVGVGEAWTGVGQRMQNNMESHICGELHYDHYRNMRYNHQFSNVRFKHILLPVWIASYTFKKKVYQFMVNGETGKINGKAPVSAAKVLTAVGIILAIVALFVLLAYAMGEPQALT